MGTLGNVATPVAFVKPFSVVASGPAIDPADDACALTVTAALGTTLTPSDANTVTARPPTPRKRTSDDLIGTKRKVLERELPVRIGRGLASCNRDRRIRCRLTGRVEDRDARRSELREHDVLLNDLTLEGHASGRRAAEAAHRVGRFECEGTGWHTLEAEAAVGQRRRLEARLDDGAGDERHSRRRDGRHAIGVHDEPGHRSTRRLEDRDIDEVAFPVQRTG